MQLFDSFRNIVSGLGEIKDKGAHGHFHHKYLGRNELDALYTSDWAGGTIVDAPCDDMTREWREWKGGARQIKAIEKEEKRLRIRQQVNKAMKLGRLYGGAGLLLGTGDPDPTQPINTESLGLGGLKYVHALSRWEIIASQIIRDPLDPHYGEPEYYTLATSTSDAGVQIHPSRVIRFFGQARLELQFSVDGWGLSTLQRAYDAIRNFTSVAANVNALINEAKVDIISVPGLSVNSLDPTYTARIMSRFGLANTLKSTNQAVLLDKEEVWNQRQLSVAGYPNVMAKFMEILAGAAGLPVTRLMGVATKGLNATGDAEIRHYYDGCAAKQENEVSPALDALDDLLIRSAIGSRPERVGYVWRPLWQMTEAEEAAIALQRAQTAQVYGNLGITSAEAMRAAIISRLIEDRTYPGLEDAISANPDKPPAPLTTAPPVEAASPKDNITKPPPAA